ncbi:hypothetical protein AAFO92_18605 [Roseovarius sp. CAU 1744]|uniref:hypothetical protein n=1 Tax=Roseovarius sp. CAU 1744 TaxID=3140368 RepID=UPI00325B1120
MSALQNISHIAQQIEDALAAQTVPPRVRQTGMQLLEQLRRPLQITMIGMPQSGKTSLINVMLDQVRVKDLPDAAVVEIIYGPQHRTTFELKDGSQVVQDGPADNARATQDVYRARLEIPDERLFLRSFAEIRLTGVESDDKKLLDYAAGSTSVAIWCSEAFSADEQQLWSAMPEHIKDHGFLALTMADRQLMKNRLAKRIAELEDFVANEFLGLYPVATLQAMAARRNGEAQSSDLWKRSGGDALCRAVDRQVSLGQSEDHDRAMIYLEQLAATGPAKQRRADAPDKPASKQTQPAPRQTDAGPAKDMLQQALQRLKAGADKMLGEVSASRPPGSKHIIKQCVAALQDLSELFSDVSSTAPSVQDLLDDVQEGTDMLLLLQLEEGETSAADAVALMLQLNKEISVHAYA